jgi:hypothetical protein
MPSAAPIASSVRRFNPAADLVTCFLPWPFAALP